MEMANPFRPGTASVPPHFAGRIRVLNSIDFALGSHGNNYGSFLVIHGARGLGKTSLLNELGQRSKAASWASINYEVPRNGPLLRPLLEQLQAIESLPARLVNRIKDVSAEWSAQEQTIDLKMYRRTARRDATALPIAERFVDAVQQIASHQTDRASGLAIGIDEVQNADPAELSVLGPLVQKLSSQADQSILIALSGLPSVPSHLNQAFTYSERWAFHPLENLTPVEANLALALPAHQAGKRFDVDAVHIASEASRGYPFAVQLIGFNAWNESTGETITVADVNTAINTTTEQLASSLYTQRWHGSTKLQRDYLAAAAHSPTQPPRTGDIATTLGRTPQQLSTTRAELISNGALTTKEHGTIEEAIPGLLNYVRNRPESADLIIASQNTPLASAPNQPTPEHAAGRTNTTNHAQR